MADTTPNLTWPNLASHNLMAQLVVSSRGVNTLLIRPLNPDEPESVSANRANTLNNLLQKIVNRIDNPSKLQSRLVGGTLNALVGQSIDTPAKMSAFLQKAFPRATLMEMSLEGIRQEEAIRREAMEYKATQTINKTSQFNQASQVALNKALPDTLTFMREDNQYVLRQQDGESSQMVFTHPITDETTNGSFSVVIKNALEEAWKDQRTDNLDALNTRLVTLNNKLDTQNLGYWEHEVARIEKDILTGWEAEAKEKLDALINLDIQSLSLDDLKKHEKALKTKQDNQGQLDNPVLNQAILNTQDRISEQHILDNTPELAGGQREGLDNVQENEDFEEGDVAVSLGFNADGEEIFEDGTGSRFKFQRGERVRERQPGLPFSVQGRPLMTDREKARSLEWLTLEEALERPYSGLPLEMRLRAGFDSRVGDADNRRQWAGLTVEHGGQTQPVMVRELTPATDSKQAVLQILYLDARSLTDDQPVTLNGQLMQLSEDNRLLNAGLPQKAPEALLKNWAALGLSLPQNTPQNILDALEGAKVNPSTSHEGTNNESRTDTDTQSAGGTSAAPGEAEPADAEGFSGRVPAGGRSGRNTDDSSGLSGADSDSISDAVADRNERVGSDGESEGGERESGNIESLDGTAGDQQSETADAGATVRGSDGSGDREPGHDDTGAGTTEDGKSNEQSLGATNGGDAHVSGSPAGTPEEELAEKPATGGGAARPDGSPAGVPDAPYGESEEPGAVDDGATAGSDRDTGGVTGQPSINDEAQATDTAVPEPERPAGSGTDFDSDSDGDGSGLGVGGDDWERFADEQSDSSPERPEPLRGSRELEERSGRQRLSDNIQAIELLREVQGNASDPDLTATFSMEEREVLSRFSGFGGIHPQLFGKTWEHSVPQWVREATTTISRMPDDGFLTRSQVNSIQSTILNAHYTHSGIIEPLWESIDRMGVPIERVLEPSCGSANFKAYMPEAVADKVSSFTGVEIDELTARIAQSVHPDARIINSGFEKTTFPDSFFDAVVSNVPFGDYKVFDPQNPTRRDSIHNAFFLKALDKVRPGGVIAFVSSSYTLDSKDNQVRQQIMDRSHVMGVYRLPNGTFKKTTGTEVVTDVIFLQKKGDFTPSYEPLNILDTRQISAPLASASSIEILDEEIQPGEMVSGFDINQAFVEDPSRIAGDLHVVSGRYGPELSVGGGGDVDEQRDIIRSAFASLPSNIKTDARKTVTADELDALIAQEQQSTQSLADLPGALSIENDEIYIVTSNENGTPTRALDTQIPKNMKNRAKAAIETMTALSDLLDAETKGLETDEELDKRRADVRAFINGWEKLEQKTKAAFTKKAWKAIQNDPRAQRIQFHSLYDEENRTIKEPDIVHGRTVRPISDRPNTADTIEDALAISLAYTATVSETYMVDLLKDARPDINEDTLRTELTNKELAFVDPATNQMIERAAYLSGNLRPKIDAVESIIDSAPEFKKNLDALEASLPAPLSASQIKVSLDAFWLPEDVLNQFLSESLDIRTTGPTGVTAYFDDVQRHWRLKAAKESGSPSMASIARSQEYVTMARWGTTRKNALDLLNCAFTNTIPKVLDPIPNTKPRKYKINTEETLKAQAKYDEIKDAFDRWIYRNPERSQRLVDLYNHKQNATVLYEPDGSHMVFPGMAESWVPRKHQSDFIWRAVSGKNSMTAHVVGAGKTLQLIGACIRGKQMGRWRKGMVVVPNHMLEQFANDGQDIYPNAKILVMSAADARASNRAAFAAKAAMGDWDMIVCTHSVFEKVTVPQEFEAQIIGREIEKLRAALADEDTQKTPKEVEKSIKRLEERLERTMESINNNSENILNMQEIGVDFIGIDEAHYYKNLMLDTSRSIPGVSNASSKRAMNMLIKCQYLRELHGDCYGVMMATGTPISNSVTECYTFTRMLRPDLLEEAGIQNFNDWMGLFGEITHGMEIKPEGGGYQMKSRLSNFKNIPELVKMIRTFIDFKTREDLNLPSPEVHHETVTSDQTEGWQTNVKNSPKTVLTY